MDDDTNAAPESTEPADLQAPVETGPEITEPVAPAPAEQTEGATVPDPVTDPDTGDVNGSTEPLYIVGGADRFAYYTDEGTEDAPNEVKRFVTRQPSDVPSSEVERVLASAASVGISIAYVNPPSSDAAETTEV